MLLRVVLGGLFGLVLTLPFGFESFQTFCKAIVFGPKSESGKDGMTTEAILLLLPFVLGFSTSLVIMILNRLPALGPRPFSLPIAPDRSRIARL
jgi:hypothetical protein